MRHRLQWPAVLLALAAATSPALAQSTPPSTAQSVAAAIRSSAGKLKGFYVPRGYAPLWIHDDRIGPEADRLIAILEQARRDGLDPGDYDPDALREIVEEARNGSPEALARAEIRLSRAFAAYVRDARYPAAVKMVYIDSELVPQRLTPVAVLRLAGVAPSFADYLQREGWMNPLYVQLRDGLADYHARWADLPAIPIGTGPTLRPGMKSGRVAMLRQRLGFPDGATFDKALAKQVRAFQVAHGLKPDAVVGASTIATLDRDPAEFERTIALNLERARVLPGFGRRYIVVDAAGARLWMYENGELRDTMRVIVGKPQTPTPMLVGMMRYAVVNPYWNVPMELIRDRIAPKVLQGASLSGMGYEALADWSANAQPLDPTAIDWTAVAEGRQQLRIRQLPGKTNAMGNVKFMFPNDLGVYLHDTPDKALFQETDRRFSSGCVRVEDAPRLAKWLFGRPLVPPSDAPEQPINLPQAVPVYITYLTAAPTETGIAFRDDAYGRDMDGEEHATAE